MDEMRILFAIIGCGLYYTFVLDPLLQKNADLEKRGPAAITQLHQQVEADSRRIKTLGASLDRDTSRLAQKYGTLRFAGPDVKQPLDILLDSIEKAASEHGITRQSVTPTTMPPSGPFETQVVRLDLKAREEGRVYDFLEDLLGSQARVPAMLDHLSIRVSKDGLDVDVGLSLIQDVPAGSPTREDEVVSSWLDLEIPLATFTDPHLVQALEPAPSPPPTTPPPPPSQAALDEAIHATGAEPAPTREAHQPARLPLPPSMKLVGVAGTRAGDAAIVVAQGQESLVTVGETVQGWTLTAIHGTHIMLAKDSDEAQLRFPEDQAHETAPAIGGP